MRTRFTLPLLALGLATLVAAPSAAQSVNDFRLPPNPSPTPTPRAQGPVDDSGVVPVAPRAIPTASPTRTPAPSPTPNTSPAPSPSSRPSGGPDATPAPRTTAPATSARPLPAPAATPTQPAPTADQSTTEPSPATGTDFPTALPTGNPPPPSTITEPAEASSLPDWWWIAALGALLAALAAGLFFWRQRNASKAPPEIMRPVVGGGNAAVADDLLRYLKVEVDAVRLARSVMAATLTYRVTLSNRASEAIRNITLDGDLTSAHGQAPISEQLADTLTALPQMHQLDHLGAGQSKSFTGEIRLALKDVRPIQQGNIPIYIPLVRLKASAAGAEAKAFTFVVGLAPAMGGGRLQPFRLDTPPQTFNEIDARPLG